MGNIETGRLLDPRYLDLEGVAAETNPLRFCRINPYLLESSLAGIHRHRSRADAGRRRRPGRIAYERWKRKPSSDLKWW